MIHYKLIIMQTSGNYEMTFNGSNLEKSNSQKP